MAQYKFTDKSIKGYGKILLARWHVLVPFYSIGWVKTSSKLKNLGATTPSYYHIVNYEPPCANNILYTLVAPQNLR